ncbi:hypothetical protein BKH46_01940 [Helicobacter sp. 12S02634-8]|uniref:FAD-dependent oxidoreductase n=1 Tax=Helicobacter sp. 12S02634-8 TaxID=1476199 RepID=UPI000BA5A8B3|nr:FAD-dependent oxidoreductase [Helicobacter sp. 12S02634-8]PAF48096.1 hypothetical protein BKH46_01940 [Helicobacter sp. 12S02634-8]
MQMFDIVVIGFGKAGKTLALKSASMGKKVALIEQSKDMYGGTCINIGCIPTKALITQAHQAQACASPKDTSYQQSMAKKTALVEFLRAKNYEMLAQNENITIFDGKASFLDQRTIQIVGEKTQCIQGKKICINTGAQSAMLSIPIESQRVYTSTTLLSLTTRPKELVIIGAGYIGLEFACMYANFGTKVSILVRGDTWMPKEDRDIAEFVLESMKKLGIEIIMGACVQAIQDKADDRDDRDDKNNGRDGGTSYRACVSYESAGVKKEIFADAVLVAIGRKPYTEGLNLQKAGVGVDGNGAVIVDRFLRTQTEGIYALGDVKGAPFFTYVSLDDFRIVFDGFYGKGARSVENRSVVPEVLFLSTPLAHTGLREKEAIKQGYAIKIGKLATAAIPRARILGDTTGMLKLIVDAKTDVILGASLFCVDAPEIINIFSLAINAKLPYQSLQNMIFTHPSMSEAINDLCGTLS